MRRIAKEGENVSNKVYDILKWNALVVFPAIATLFSAISMIWGIPYGEQITGTIIAIDTALGAILGVSSIKYVNKAGDSKWNTTESTTTQ
jgi:hypothetical protein